MTDREYFKKRAEHERTAAIAAKDPCACRVHMEMAREYEFLAACEPETDEPATGE